MTIDRPHQPICAREVEQYNILVYKMIDVTGGAHVSELHSSLLTDQAFQRNNTKTCRALPASFGPRNASKHPTNVTVRYKAVISMTRQRVFLASSPPVTTLLDAMCDLSLTTARSFCSVFVWRKKTGLTNQIRVVFFLRRSRKRSHNKQRDYQANKSHK